jgi:hypothetical protein
VDLEHVVGVGAVEVRRVPDLQFQWDMSGEKH